MPPDAVQKYHPLRLLVMFNKTVERFEFLFKRFGTGPSSMELQVRYSVARFAYAMKEKIDSPKELCSASAALRSHAITTSHRKQFIENLPLSPQRKNILSVKSF